MTHCASVRICRDPRAGPGFQRLASDVRLGALTIKPHPGLRLFTFTTLNSNLYGWAVQYSLVKP